jgi:hypothetical protein
MFSMSTLPITTAEQELPTTVRHALVEDLKGVVEALRAGPLPNTDDCLHQLRVVVSRVQRSVDLATTSAELSSNFTVEELEAAYSLTRARSYFLLLSIVCVFRLSLFSPFLVMVLVLDFVRQGLWSFYLSCLYPYICRT